MDYSDEIRQYNFFSGLALGAVLGVGLALALRPARRLAAARPERSTVGAWRGRAAEGLEHIGETLRQGVGETIRAGREHLQR